MRPPILPLYSVLLVVAAVRAQDAPAPAQEIIPPPGAPKSSPLRLPPALPQGSVIGTVFCSDTRKPARGAVVLLYPKPESNQTGGPGDVMARVSLDGSFVLQHVKPGTYAVIPTLPGYLSPLDEISLDRQAGNDNKANQQIWEKLVGNSVVTVNGTEAARVELMLERGAAVSGRILYSDGAPATQVSVELQNVNAKPQKTNPSDPELSMGALMRTLLTHENMNTDDQGHFRIAGIPPGKYRVAAVQPSSGPTDLGEGGGMTLFFGNTLDPLAVRTYAGDTLHKSEAKAFELRSGDEVTGVDISIPSAFHAVRGTAAAKDGRPLNLGTLTLTDAGDDSLIYRTTIQRDGSFLFPAVPSGTYTLALKDGRIGMLSPEAADYSPLQPTNAFADASTQVIVGESDIGNASVVTQEVPLPKPVANQTQPQPEP